MSTGLPTLDELARVDEPWTGYATLRDEAPVYRLPDRNETWLLSRYDDVRAALADPTTFSSSMVPDTLPAMMVHRDGDAHDRLGR